MSRPGPLFTPGKDPVPIVQEAGWAPGPVWTGAENLAPTGIRSPDRPARNQSLYRLRYPTHKSTVTALECRRTTIHLQSLEVQTRDPCSVSYVQQSNKREFRPFNCSESTVTGVVLPDMLAKLIMSIRFWKKRVLMTCYPSKTERLCILTLQSEPPLGTVCGS